MKSFFANSNFKNILCARVVSYAGTCLQTTALALYIVDQSSTVSALATVLSLVIIPQIVFGPIGGLVADRFNKRSIMMVSDLFGLCVSLYLYRSVYLNHVDISHIYVASLLLSLSVVFFAPAIDSIFPQIMNSEELTRGNSLYHGALDVVQIIAPIMGAAAYSFLGIQYVFFINAISFLVSFGFLCRVNITAVTRTQSAHEGKKSRAAALFHDLFSPVVIFFKDRTLRDMMILNYVIGIFVLPLMSIGFISVLKHTLQLNNALYGYLQSILVVGALCGAVIVNSFAKNRTSLECVASSLAFLAVTLFLQSLCIYAWDVFVLDRYVMYALILVFGFLLSVILRLFYIPMHVLVQSNTNIEHLGRVSSFYWMLSLVAQPIGQFYISYFIDCRSLGSWLILSSIVVLAAFLYSTRKETLRCAAV